MSQPQHHYQSEPEVTPEQVPLLQQQQQHTPGHSRTRSVDTSQSASPQSRPQAPGRHHQRTRSLEEWANMFGISGISGGQTDVVHERKDVLTRAKKNSRKNKPPRPPLAPKAPSFASPSSISSVSSRQKHRRLDSIAESEQDTLGDFSKKTQAKSLQEVPEQYDGGRATAASIEEEEDVEAPPENYDGGRAAFAAAALGQFHSASSGGSNQSHIQQERLSLESTGSLHEPNETLRLSNETLRLSTGSQDSRNLRLSNGSSASNNTLRLSTGSQASHKRSGSNSPAPHYLEPDSPHSCSSASTFSSIPQHLTTGYSSDVGSEDSSALDFSKSPASQQSSQFSTQFSTPPTTDRLAKFEREQEIMFQQKRTSMERELSNVLERNAVKTHREKQEFINTYMMELEKERAKLVAQWKEEWEKEEEYLRQRDPKRKLLRDLSNKIGALLDSILFFVSSAEVFISNMPLTIAALALSWVSMGCVWFKFMEENIDACAHVHFYSPHCTFPEFPGCFECDVTNFWYQLGVHWHYFCSIVSFTFCSMIILKVIIAWDVVKDELGNPTTSTPCGVFCIAMVCVFAGRGPLGELVVLITATFHFMLAFFFLYMALYKYRLYPDPGWFPNTVGISYAAVKSFLYLPMYGEMLMMICLTFFVGVFFISALRVATNPKIAAPICWFMISAPSITLYAVTLIQQPVASEEAALENNPQMRAHFVNFLQHYYLPLHHFLFACSLIGVCSAVHGVWSRWEKFKEKPFSPAHVAFVAPTLSHTNAIQAYRGTVAALSSFPAGGKYRTFIYIYWCLFLFAGTIVNFIFTYKFLKRLPEWTKFDIGTEEAPPPPEETMTHEMLDDRGAHETMLHQTFVSPAVLEANEAGALIRVRRGTEEYRRYGPFIRSRKVTARGFDPSMNDAELREERAALLDWVAKNAPRTRNRTMSIPGVMHLTDKSGRNVYGTFLGSDPSDSFEGAASGHHAGVRRTSSKHARSRTSVDSFW